MGNININLQISGFFHGDYMELAPSDPWLRLWPQHERELKLTQKRLK